MCEKKSEKRKWNFRKKTHKQGGWLHSPVCIFATLGKILAPQSNSDQMPPLKTYSLHKEFCRSSDGGGGGGGLGGGGGGGGSFLNGDPNSNTESSRRPPPYSNAQFPFKVLANLNKLREQSRFCDVEIIAGGTTFNAHRAVLSAASAYFEAMFRPELGLNEGKQKSVILHTIDGEILHILLDFIYTGRCEIMQVCLSFGVRRESGDSCGGIFDAMEKEGVTVNYQVSYICPYFCEDDMM